MRKLLLFIGVSTALTLVASVAVLAQELGDSDLSGQYRPAPEAQYEPAPVSGGHDQPVPVIEDPDDLLKEAAEAYQYEPAACADPSCNQQVQQSVGDSVLSAAEDASGPSEDLPRALDAAAPAAEGGDGPAVGAALAEEPDDRAPGPDEETTARAPGNDGEGRSAPGTRPARGGRGEGGPEGAVASGELPATGGPSAPVAPLVVGCASLLMVGGLLVRRVVR